MVYLGRGFGSGPAGGGRVRCTCVSIRSSFARPIATCSSCRGVVRCNARLNAHERTRHLERQVALETGRLDLRLLAQSLRLQERGEQQPDEQDDDAATGRCAEEPHQKRK